MKDYVDFNIGPNAPAARRISGLTIETRQNRGAVIKSSARFTQLGVLLSKMGSPGVGSVYGMGFDIVQSGTNLVFKTYVPRNVSAAVRMDIDNGTLDEARYGVAAPTVTRPIVAGQGEGVARAFKQTTNADSLASEATWGRKIEFFKDRRDTDDPTVLDQELEELLAAGAKAITSTSVRPSETQTMEFAKDWFVGDVVGVTIDSTPVAAVVSEAIIKINTNGISIGATVGTPQSFDYQDKIIAQQKEDNQRIAFLEKNAEMSMLSPGLMIKQSSAYPPDNDLNKAVGSGFYQTQGGTTLNSPNNTLWWNVRVENGGGRSTQYASRMDNSSPLTYKRWVTNPGTGAAPTWSDWHVDGATMVMAYGHSSAVALTGTASVIDFAALKYFVPGPIGRTGAKFKSLLAQRIRITAQVTLDYASATTAIRMDLRKNGTTIAVAYGRADALSYTTLSLTSTHDFMQMIPLK